MKKFFYLMFLIIVFSCAKDDERVTLQAINYELSDLGKIPFEFEFQSYLKENNVHAVKMTTKHIRQNDSIESIEAFMEGKTIYLIIKSSPHDFEWWNPDTSRFTIHELSFDLIGIKNGEYQVDVFINNSRDKYSNFIHFF